MSYKAHDGKVLPSVVQGRRYDRSLDEQRSMVDKGKSDVEDAPGGEPWEHDIKQHGVVTKSTVEFEGNGRWRHTATHANGHESTSVHPQWFRAHEVAGHYFDPDGKPAALETHQRARSQPVGPKEDERVAREDGRITGQSQWEDFEDK